MKRLATSIGVMASCLAGTVGTAIAKPAQDQVTGTGQGVFPTDFGPFSSQAHVNAKGTDAVARGEAWSRFFNTPAGDILVKGSVFCVNADGNQATVGFIIERSNISTAPPGSAIVRKVIDNGQGGGDPPDQTGTTVFLVPPATCPPPALTPIPTGPVDQGNFVVQDGV